MMFLVALLATLIVAWRRGGSLERLGALKLRRIWLIAASFAIQIALYLPGLRSAPLVLHAGGLIYVLALLLALAGIASNWTAWPLRIAALGLGLNLIVIAANGGAMPVNAAALRQVQPATMLRDIGRHARYWNSQLATGQTRLTVLSDIIPLSAPGGHGNVYSLGDVVLAIGVCAYTYRAVVSSQSA